MASYGYTFTSGDTVTPTKLNNARTVSDIVNADIKSDAAIAGTKIAPAFGAQNITVGSADRSITNTTNHALAFGTNNTERMRIDSAGRVLIGVSTNIGSQSLQVHSVSPADVAGVYRWVGDSAGPRINLVKSRGTSVGTNTVVQNGDSLGLIRFHGADGSDTASIGASIEVYVDGTPGTNDMPGRLVFSTTADGASSATERMRIDSAGNVVIGTSAAFGIGSGSADGFSLAPEGTANISRNNERCLNLRRRSSNGTIQVFNRDTTVVGTISVTTTATAYNTSSDYRLKENATPLIGGLSTIEQLQPCEFTWKSDGSTGRGFIAHELQAVVPEAVTGEKDAVDGDGNPEYQGVDAAKLVPYLVSAVQELKARVEALEAA